ncbi:hypothetical protein JCM1841_000098 [Sporobolomyces salmonicolor]
MTDKGKGRASDSFAHSSDLETAPLLTPDSSSTPSTPHRKSRLRHGRGPLVRDDSDEDEPLPPNASDGDDLLRVLAVNRVSQPRERLTCSSIACLFFVFLFVALLVSVAAMHLWIGHLISEQGKQGSAKEMAQRGLLWAGPSAVRVQAVEGGEPLLMLEMDGMAGIDVRKALDWETKEGGGWMRRMEGRVARWGIGKARSVAVSVGKVAFYDAGDDDRTTPLLVVDGMETLRLPLSYPTKADPLPAMRPFTLHVPIFVPSPDALARFGRTAWEDRQYRVEVDVYDISVLVGEADAPGIFGRIMRRMGAIELSGVTRTMIGNVPDLPGISDPMSLVSLQSCTAFQTPSPGRPNETVIAMNIRALMKNPLEDAVRDGRIPAVAWSMPYRLPVSVHLPLPPDAVSKDGPTDVTLARVSSAPFSFPLHARTASVACSGHVVPVDNLLAPHDPNEGKPPLSIALSRFVARYLSGRPNDIFIRYDPAPSSPLPQDPSPDAPFPPPFLADLARNQTLKISFPGTNEVPDMFRNLRMEDMRIRLGDGDDGDLLASGKVVGEIVLPDAAKSLEEGIDAKSILPDVIVMDGEPPRALENKHNDVEAGGAFSRHDQLAFSFVPPSEPINLVNDEDSTEYPPSPLPANAFARMRPTVAIAATTIHTPANSTHNATTIVSATFVDAPLFLLPGRGDVFRRFVAKIVFGSGKVKASMKGISAVEVGLKGFGEIGLEDVPIEASFMVGRSGVESVEAYAALF